MKPFAELPLSLDLQATVAELGYTTATPIQEAAIPVLLEGRDLIGQAKTGSGKTAAFALPILQAMDLTKVSVQALILCPTRELGSQVTGEIRKLGRRHKDLRVLLLAGGQPSRPQAEALASGVHIVVGTPGRTLDHIQRGRLDLTDIQTVVLDEADRMLDMGFQDEMKMLMEALPPKRQTALFSATFPEFIASLSRHYQHQPVRLTIEEANEAEAEPEIEQIYFEMEDEPKVAALLRALQQFVPKSAMVFCNQKATVNEVMETLRNAGVDCDCLHGDLEQRDRDRVLAMFRNGSTRVLIATDVAARGLDIEDLDLVVNFDLPHQAEIYVHRIGRTGRAGKTGRALSLVAARERARFNELQTEAGVRIGAVKLGFKHQHGLGPDSVLREAPMQTLVIAGGRKDKLRPGDILGALTGATGGLNATSVGKIEVHDRFAYVAVASPSAHQAVKRLQAGRIKNRRFLVKLLSH